ncbi:MAG: PocR ligand-binding domain-containing protein, partial [Lachnospiraceae bacterium]|nr:PocR ligand-binding domain-containing protein [Lachnospiraceae bacterium]
MVLKDYIDSRKLRELQSSFSEMAGLDAVIVDMDGNYLTDKKDFLEGGDTASYDILVNGEQLGSVVTPQSLDRKAKRAAEMLSTMIGQTATIEYLNNAKSGKFDSVKDDIRKSGELVQMINEKT